MQIGAPAVNPLPGLNPFPFCIRELSLFRSDDLFNLSALQHIEISPAVVIIEFAHMHSHLINIVRWLYPFCQGVGFGVIAMLLHECGHLFAALVLGLRIKNVGMKWNKGLYTVRQQGTPLQNLLVALGGPLANLILFAAASRVPLFGLANFCYALANMLPIEGSDGYRIALCWQQLRAGEPTIKKL